jgi:hypothetical protein
LIWFRTAIVTHMAHGPCGEDNPSEFLAKYVEGAVMQSGMPTRVNPF